MTKALTLNTDGSYSETDITADIPINVVLTDSDQEITGYKTFSNNITTFGNGTPGLSSLQVIGAGTPSPVVGEKINIHDMVNGWIQFNIQNLSNLESASADICITADNGTETENYLDLGLNNSGYDDEEWTVADALDAYLYSQSSNFCFGTATVGKNLNFFTGGTLIENIRLIINDSNIVPKVPINIPASQGITITSGIPTETTNSLYQENGILYFGTDTLNNSYPVISNIPYSATLDIDARGIDIIRITLIGNCIINFTNGNDGQKLLLELTQDAGGSKTVTLGSGIGFGVDITSFTATTTGSKTDILGFIYNSAASKFRLIAIAQGY